MNPLMTRLLASLALALPLVAHAESLLIKGGDIYTGGKLIPATDIFIDNGRIEAMGKNLSMSADKVVDAAGQSITAGLFNSYTQLGVVEVSAIEQTVDYYTERPDITAALKMADAFNPNSTLLPHNRAHGLTHAVVMPESGAGMFSGTVALAQLGQSPRIVRDNRGVAVDFTEAGVALAGNSRAAALALLRQALNDARDFSANKRAAMAGESREFSLSLMDLAALEPVLKGETLLFAKVERASDIRQMLALAKAYNLKLMLVGASEGWMLADEIAAAKVPVLMDPIENLPTGYQSLGARLDNAALLHRAGVELLFTGMSWHNTHNAYLVRQSAGNAVANGLDKHVAIAAMTTNPARWFNAPVKGDLSQGGLADLVVWSGDPLEVTSMPTLVIAAGGEASLVTRATMLRDRYFERLRPAQ